VQLLCIVQRVMQRRSDGILIQAKQSLDRAHVNIVLLLPRNYNYQVVHLEPEAS
jgi:hypothetical protein